MNKLKIAFIALALVCMTGTAMAKGPRFSFAFNICEPCGPLFMAPPPPPPMMFYPAPMPCPPPYCVVEQRTVINEYHNHCNCYQQPRCYPQQQRCYPQQPYNGYNGYYR